MTRRDSRHRRRRAEPPQRLRHSAAAIFLVLLASYAYFHSGGGWNQNSRFDLVRAIVEQGTVRIDAYHENTGDKSRFGGHVYSDKAPGASMTAVPAVALARAAAAAAGANLQDRSVIAFLAYVATLAASAVPGALVGVMLFFFARRTGAGDRVAAEAALIAGLGTPLWAHATLFWGHVPAACCLLAAVAALDWLRHPAGRRRDLLRGLAIGVLAGWAVVTEFPAAVPAVIIAATAIAVAWRDGVTRVTHVAMGLAAGAASCAVVLGGYQWIAFGSPLHVGYSSLEDPTLLDAGFFGITVPKPAILIELLFGSYRGLLPLAPAIAAGAVGLWMLGRRRDTRPVAIAAGSSGVYYLLLNAAYEHWEGGWSYGPRHLTPAVALVALGLPAALAALKPVGRALVLAAGVWGAAHSLVAVATTTQPPSQQYSAPMRQLLWPAFRDGNFSLNTQSFLDALPPRPPAPRGAFNLGELAGLRGVASLLPLGVIYFVIWIVWRRSGGSPRESSRRPRRPFARACRTSAATLVRELH